jgi:hypothetical protein
MLHTVHIHEDDLELYSGGRLEPERILVVEWHLSICHTCRERLSQCIGVPLEEENQAGERGSVAGGLPTVQQRESHHRVQKLAPPGCIKRKPEMYH